jgi:hypothetical protein
MSWFLVVVDARSMDRTIAEPASVLDSTLLKRRRLKNSLWKKLLLISP